MTAVLGRSQTGLDQPTIDDDIVDALDGAQPIVAGAVRNVSRSRWTLLVWPNERYRTDVDEQFQYENVYYENATTTKTTTKREKQ